jgi:hypothetical protein
MSDFDIRSVLTPTVPGTSNASVLTPTVPGTSNASMTTPPMPGTLNESVLTPTVPGTSNEGVLTPTVPGTSATSSGKAIVAAMPAEVSLIDAQPTERVVEPQGQIYEQFDIFSTSPQNKTPSAASSDTARTSDLRTLRLNVEAAEARNTLMQARLELHI